MGVYTSKDSWGEGKDKKIRLSNYTHKKVGVSFQDNRKLEIITENEQLESVMDNMYTNIDTNNDIIVISTNIISIY